MKTVADLLKFLALPDELYEKVQRQLASFQALPDVTKEQRQHAAETVFSAVFGQNAILKTGSKFGQYSESTWLVLSLLVGQINSHAMSPGLQAVNSLRP